MVYLAGVFAIAAFAHRRSRGKSFLKEYYIGGRTLGSWTLAFTFAATSASGGTYTGFPSLIYTYGWVLALWIAGYMVFPICSMGLLGKRLNQVARKSDAITFPDLFRDRFACPWLGVLVTLFLLFFLVVYLVGQFKAGGVLFQTLMTDFPTFEICKQSLEPVASGLPGVSAGYLAGLVFFALSVVLYTAFGGFRAVVLTDVMQGVIMVVGVTLLLPLTLYQAYVHLAPVGDPRAVVAAAWTEEERYAGMEVRKTEAFRFSQLPEGLRKVNSHLQATEPEALVAPGRKKSADEARSGGFEAFLPIGMAISFFFIWPIGGAGQAGNMLRLMAFRDNKTLARAIFTVTICYSLIYLPLVVTFVAAKTLPLHLEQSDQAMPAMSLFAAPPFLAGLLIAAPFAAVMSTVDSFLLMISSALVRDLYQHGFNPNVSERTIKRASLATTLAVGFGVMLMAADPPRYLQDLLVFGSSSQAATFLIPMALALYWPRANAAGTACSMFAGFLGVASLYLVGKLRTGEIQPWTPLDLHPFMWGLAASLVGGIVGTLLTPKPPQELVVKYFYRRHSNAR